MINRLIFQMCSRQQTDCLLMHLVCPQTEKTMYNDSFFLNQDLIVNALDNVEARRYMDRSLQFAVGMTYVVVCVMVDVLFCPVVV